MMQRISISFGMLVVLGNLLLVSGKGIAAVSEYTSYLSVDTRTMTLAADGTAKCTVVVTIKSETGAVLSGQAVKLQTSNPNYDIIGDTNPSNGVTLSDGQCTFTIKSSYAGEDTITATCQGVTIRENILSNPSFERDDNSDSRPDDWEWNPNGSTTFVSLISPGHSGSNAVKLVDNSASAGVGVWQTTAVSPNTNYKFSCWKKEDYLEVYLTWLTENSTTIYTDYKGFTNTDTQQYEYFEYIKTSPAASAKCKSMFCSWSGLVTTAWFDDVRLQRIPPTINFTAYKLKITSSPDKIIKVYRPSYAIVVEASGKLGGKDASKSGVLSLLSSSSTGRFYDNIISRYDYNISTIPLNNGSATFYYRDTTPGTHTITVSGLGLDEDSISIAVSEIPSSKKEPSIFSPNNDGINDEVTIFFKNDSYEEVKGKVFDLYGFLIRDNLSPEPDLTSLKWNGKDNNSQIVNPGVYIYQINVGSKIVNGTILLAR